MRRHSGSSGIGILEVIIATVILIIVAFGVSQYLSGSKKMSLNLGRKGACQELLGSILDDFNSTDNKVDVLNELVFPRYNNGRIGRNLIEGTQYYSFQNIEGTFTKLYQMVRATPAFCDSSANAKGVQLTSSPLYIKDQQLLDRGYTIFLKILPNTGSCAALPEITSQNAAGDGDQVKLSVVLTAERTSPDGQVESCQAESTFGYDRDAVPPAITLESIEGRKGPTVVPPVQPVNTICDTGFVVVNLTSSEPGSVFVCSPDNNDGSYRACQGYTLAPGVMGDIVQRSGSMDNNPVLAELRFSGLPDGAYRFYVKAVDTGGNESADAPLVSFTVDTLRPIWSSGLTPVADSVDPTRSAVATASQLPIGSNTAAPSQVLNEFGTSQLYQCSLNSVPRFQGLT